MGTWWLFDLAGFRSWIFVQKAPSEFAFAFAGRGDRLFVRIAAQKWLEYDARDPHLLAVTEAHLSGVLECHWEKRKAADGAGGGVAGGLALFLSLSLSRERERVNTVALAEAWAKVGQSEREQSLRKTLEARESANAGDSKEFAQINLAVEALRSGLDDPGVTTDGLFDAFLDALGLEGVFAILVKLAFRLAMHHTIAIDAFAWDGLGVVAEFDPGMEVPLHLIGTAHDVSELMQNSTELAQHLASMYGESQIQDMVRGFVFGELWYANVDEDLDHVKIRSVTFQEEKPILTLEIGGVESIVPFNVPYEYNKRIETSKYKPYTL